ncbi:pentatricopeptide (PPR) domain protein 40 [Carex rostrata]
MRRFRIKSSRLSKRFERGGAYPVSSHLLPVSVPANSTFHRTQSTSTSYQYLSLSISPCEKNIYKDSNLQLISTCQHRVLAILSENNNNWFSLLSKEFQPYLQRIDPRFVISFLQNADNPVSLLKFYLWVSNCNPKLAKDSSVVRVLSDLLWRKGPVILSDDLIREVKSCGCNITEDLLCILIRSWGKLGLAKYAHDVFDKMPLMGFRLSTRLYNTVINALVAANSLDLAYMKFQQMFSDGCPPDHFTYNTLIHGACKQGIIEEAVRLLKQMERRGLSANVFTYTILIDGFCKSKKAEEAIEVLHKMRHRNVIPTEATYRSLVHGLFHCLAPKRAYEMTTGVLENEPVLQRDACNTLLYCLCKNGMASEARDFIEKISLRGLVPDATVFGAVMVCSMKTLGFDDLHLLFENFIKNGGKPGFHAYISIVQGFLKERNHAEVCKYIKQMDTVGLLSSVVSYNELINLLGEAKEMDMALEMSSEMIHRGFSPNLVTYNTLINWYSKLGEVKKARDILKKLLEHGFRPDKITFTSIIDGLCRARQLTDALKCFHEMPNWGVSPNALTYNVLIRSLCDIRAFGDASKLLNRMQRDGIKPDCYSFNALILNFCRVGEVNKARSLFSDMLRLGAVPDKYTYNAFIRVLCDENRIDEAIEILRIMKLNGCNPNPFSYQMVTEALINAGRFEEAQKLERYKETTV